MRIFVAGASGTIGIPLVKALVKAGHQVTALTRTPSKLDDLRALGAVPTLADALDPEGVRAAVMAARPSHVIHQLTALPKEGVRRAKDLEATNRLRIEGTRNLLDASIQAGARRFIGGSFAVLPREGANASPSHDTTALALESMESQILQASRAGRIEGVVLRYGLFYGPSNPSTLKMIELVRRRLLPVVRGDHSQLPCIHLDDAVSATVAALDRAPAGSLYDIVDDHAVSMTDIVRTLAEYTGSAEPFVVPAWLPRLMAPYMARMTALSLPLSNAKAKADLGWHPAFPTWRDGISEMMQHAA